MTRLGSRLRWLLRQPMPNAFSDAAGALLLFGLLFAFQWVTP